MKNLKNQSFLITILINLFSCREKVFMLTKDICMSGKSLMKHHCLMVYFKDFELILRTSITCTDS